MKLSKATTPKLVDLVLVSNYSNTSVVKHYGGLTLQKALQSNTASVSKLSKTYGHEKISEAIGKIFIGTSLYFDGTLPNNKAAIISEEIFSNYEYRSLKLEDLVALCVEIKQSNIYGSLTLNKILTALSDYWKRREQQAIQNSITASENAKSILGESDIDKRIHNSVRQLEDSSKIIVKNRLSVKKYYKS